MIRTISLGLLRCSVVVGWHYREVPVFFIIKYSLGRPIGLCASVRLSYFLMLLECTVYISKCVVKLYVSKNTQDSTIQRKALHINSELIVLSHWPHVATQVAQLVAELLFAMYFNGTVHTSNKLSNLCGNMCGNMWPV